MEHPTPLAALVDTCGIVIRGADAFDILRSLRATYRALTDRAAGPLHDLAQLRTARVRAPRRADVRPGEPLALRFSLAHLPPQHRETFLTFLAAHGAEVHRIDVAVDVLGVRPDRAVARFAPSLRTGGPIANDALRLRGDPLRRWRRHKRTRYLGSLRDDVSCAAYFDRASKLGGVAPVLHCEARLLGAAVPAQLRSDPLALLDIDAMALARRHFHVPALAAARKDPVTPREVRGRVLDVLRERMKPDGSATIADRELAQLANVPQTAVSRAIAALADSGRVHVLQRCRGRGNVSIYRLPASSARIVLRNGVAVPAARAAAGAA